MTPGHVTLNHTAGLELLIFASPAIFNNFLRMSHPDELAVEAITLERRLLAREENRYSNIPWPEPPLSSLIGTRTEYSDLLGEYRRAGSVPKSPKKRWSKSTGLVVQVCTFFW